MSCSDNLSPEEVTALCKCEERGQERFSDVGIIHLLDCEWMYHFAGGGLDETTRQVLLALYGENSSGTGD